MSEQNACLRWLCSRCCRTAGLDELHRGHDFADALTSEVLEIASLVDRDVAYLAFLTENRLLLGRVYLGERAGGLIDGFGRFEDLLGCLFGAADHGAELAI